jgi:signal transduction histidine kinase
MTKEPKNDGLGEFPARRLGILYVTTFCVIVVISALSQALVLRELSWQRNAMSAVGQCARDRSFNRPLSVSALALVAADTPEARAKSVESLRKAIAEFRQQAREIAPAGSPRRGAHGAPTSVIAQILDQSARHRDGAAQAAEALLKLFEHKASALPRHSETSLQIERIVEQEEAAGRALSEAVHAYVSAAADHLSGLDAYEFLLFGLVLVVLMLEGLFVINPAVLRIKRSVEDLARSHAELKDYSTKLERSNSELQDFASVASHDLQEPLRKVQAFSDRLRSRYGNNLDDQGRDYLDRVQNAAARMQTLINDLLTYSRVASNAQPFVATDLVSITRDVVSDLEVRIEQSNGRVEVGDLPTLDADPLQVRQLMQNLIGNSLKYRRPEVPPVVKVWSKSTPHDPLRGPEHSSRPFCQILVEDNGIGFDEVYSERIFTIFQRLHGRNEYEGTGVGLAVCRKIVERHGGTITARSTPGNGSTFMVSLPMRQSEGGNGQ